MAIELSPDPKASLLAVIAIIGILGALSLILYASNREVEQYGPSVLTASSDDRLYFDAARHIYAATRNGTILGQASFDQLGIDGPVAQLATENRDLILLDAGQNKVKRCDTGIWRCAPLIKKFTPQPSDILSFALAPEDNRLYLATGGGHSITAYDLDGQELYTLKVPKGLKYVNDMQWLGENRLLVTDTNHHRIVELLDLGEGEVELVQQLEAKNALGREGRNGPLRLSEISQEAPG
jgi:hypothetical protein